MARVTVEDCLEKIDNRFALVVVASKRTRQLLKGAKPLVFHAKNKESVLSLREIAKGRVDCLENTFSNEYVTRQEQEREEEFGF